MGREKVLKRCVDKLYKIGVAVKKGFFFSRWPSMSTHQLEASDSRNLALSLLLSRSQKEAHWFFCCKVLFFVKKMEENSECVVWEEEIYWKFFNSFHFFVTLPPDFHDYLGSNGVEDQRTKIGSNGVLVIAVPVKDNNFLKGVFAISGILITLVIYGILQEKIMRIPYGQDKESFKYSLE